MRRFARPLTVWSFWFILGATMPAASGEDFESALQNLRQVRADTADQTALQLSWETVAGADADQLVNVLAAMRDAGPLAENWLRAAVDAIAERALRDTGRLPQRDLRDFVLDLSHAPRARRTAFEWLTHIDPAARDRLLSQMVQDPSLELRYDALARVISQAERVADDDTRRSIYWQAFSAARNLAQIKQCAAALAQLGESPDLRKHFGYVTEWMVIGPFDNTGGNGFDRSFPPESEIDDSQEYRGKHGVVGWQPFGSEFRDVSKVGLIDLNEILGEEKGVTAYLAVTFNAADAQEVQCRYQTVNATKLWVNGTLLISKPVYHMGSEFDQYVATAPLRRGENTILLKLCQNEQTQDWARSWDVRFRVTDALGGGQWPLTVQ